MNKCNRVFELHHFKWKLRVYGEALVTRLAIGVSFTDPGLCDFGEF